MASTYQRPRRSLRSHLRSAIRHMEASEATASVYADLLDRAEDELALAHDAGLRIQASVLESEIERYQGLVAEMKADAAHQRNVVDDLRFMIENGEDS